MTDISPDKVEKWYGFFEKLGVVQAIKSFLTKPTIQDQFQEILNDINNNQAPLIIADKLGTAIQQKFKALQGQMPQANYYLFCTQVIKSIESHLESAVYVWKNKIVNFSEVDEIWVACEPILD
jgi:hypothetical protein